MNYNTRGRNARKTGTEGSIDKKLKLQPRSKSNKVLPPEDPDCPTDLSKIFNPKAFQDFQQEQNLKTMKSPLKFGTACVVMPENKKVMAPRNRDLPTKTLEKDPAEDQKKIEEMQLTTNVTVELLDQLNADYDLAQYLGPLDIRTSFKGLEPENTKSAVEEMHTPGTLTFQSSDQSFDGGLKNLYDSQVSFASTSTENYQQTQSSGANINELLQISNTGPGADTEMMPSPWTELEMLHTPKASFKDDTVISLSQGAVYQLENEFLLGIQKDGLELQREMPEMEASPIQSDTAWTTREEDAECDSSTVALQCLTELYDESGMNQEMACDDFQEESPRDKFALGDIVHGNTKALEDLAENHEHHLIGTGVHGVYTDKRFEALRLEAQNPSIIQSTPLGQGSFGVVVKCEGPDCLVFVKKKVIGNFHKAEALFTNAAVHPNIIKSYGLLVNCGNVEIIMEFAGQSLLSLVNTMKPLQEDIIWSLTLNLCCGLAFLDSEEVVHFDIKPENLFVQNNGKQGYLLKIGDFGSARLPGAQTEMTAWTPEYCTPEMARLFLKRKFPGMMEKLGISQSEQEIEGSLQPKTDMFSAGLVVLFMCIGEHLLYQYITRAKPDVTDEEKKKMAILLFLSNRPHIDLLLIPESTRPEMKRVLQGMLKSDVRERSSASDTMILIQAMLSAKDKKTSLPESPVKEDGGEKKIQSGRPRKRRGRVRKRKEPPSSFTPQVRMTEKSEQILAENPQLKKRMVKGELKRKLLKHPSAIPDKVMKPMELDPDSSQGSSVSSRVQMRTSFDGNQPVESPVEGNKGRLLIDGCQTGSSMQGSQTRLSVMGNQTLMPGIQVPLSTNGGQTWFWNIGGYSKDFLPLEQPFSDVQISENRQPICQAEDDWPIQESSQEPVPAGNLPDLGCLGID